MINKEKEGNEEGNRATIAHETAEYYAVEPGYHKLVHYGQGQVTTFNKGDAVPWYFLRVDGKPGVGAAMVDTDPNLDLTAMTIKEIRQVAKDMNIPKAHIKGKDRLVKEIQEISGA